MKNTLATVKSKTKTYAPALFAGVVIGASAAAIIAHRTYNPKGQIAMQIPTDVMRMMREEGKTLAVNSNAGWFTLKHVPSD